MDDKERLRRKLQKQLLAMPASQRIEKNKKACRNLISTPQFQNASVIMIYLSLDGEVDTSEVILSAWRLGKIVAAPKISWQQRHMIPVQLNSLETGSDLVVGASGMRNPVTGIPVPFEEIDMVVVPGLGFDKKGNRLGRGKSFYDRFFANPKLKAQRFGFAFDEQLVDSIPVADYDEPVDFLVTDKEVMNFKR